jgi:hypothetical protein
MVFRTFFVFMAITTTLFAGTVGTATVSAHVPDVSARHYHFSEASEGITQNMHWIETKQNGQRHIVLQSDSNITETAIGNASTTEWYYNNLTTKTELRITVAEDAATIISTINGIKKNSTVALNGTPFKYQPSFFMADVVQSSKSKQFVWVASKKEATLRQMIFTKRGKETISVHGKTYDCIKIEMKPTGLAGLVWKAYYWFDSNTGTFVKYAGRKGPPGTPEFTIETYFPKK